MLSCFYYLKCKTDLPKVTSTGLNNNLIHVETAITTSCYSSTYPKDTLAYYVSL